MAAFGVRKAAFSVQAADSASTLWPWLDLRLQLGQAGCQAATVFSLADSARRSWARRNAAPGPGHGPPGP